jgi:hypothetical protein
VGFTFTNACDKISKPGIGENALVLSIGFFAWQKTCQQKVQAWHHLVPAIAFFSFSIAAFFNHDCTFIKSRKNPSQRGKVRVGSSEDETKWASINERTGQTVLDNAKREHIA